MTRKEIAQQLEMHVQEARRLARLLWNTPKVSYYKELAWSVGDGDIAVDPRSRTRVEEEEYEYHSRLTFRPSDIPAWRHCLSIEESWYWHWLQLAESKSPGQYLQNSVPEYTDAEAAQ